VRYLAPGEPAPSNRALVEKVAALAAEHGRALASPAEARRILGLEGPTR
jgi:uncharacterized protein (DUF849 family)